MYPVKDCRLKFKPKRKIYSNSTGTCTFDPETESAYSYRWWQFVRRIKGVLVFNDYSYSPSTNAHQSAVRELLKAVGIRIDLEVRVRGGLQTFEEHALRPLYEEMFQLEVALTRKGARHSTREARLERIVEIKADIATARALGARFNRSAQKELKASVINAEAHRAEVARSERAKESDYRRKAKEMLSTADFQVVV